MKKFFPPSFSPPLFAIIIPTHSRTHASFSSERETDSFSRVRENEEISEREKKWHTESIYKWRDFNYFFHSFSPHSHTHTHTWMCLWPFKQLHYSFSCWDVNKSFLFAFFFFLLFGDLLKRERERERVFLAQ
jgi:hypothetical protein